MAATINRQQYTADINSSSDSSNNGSGINGLYRVIGGNGGGDDGDDNDLDGNGSVQEHDISVENYGYYGRRHEFMLVKASNITVTTFI